MIKRFIIAIIAMFPIAGAQAQYRGMEVPSAPAISSPMPSPLDTGSAISNFSPPPPPPIYDDQEHRGPPDQCDCYQTVYDQQGRGTRVFAGRSAQCCP